MLDSFFSHTESEHDMTDFFLTSARFSPSDDRYIPSLDKENNHAEPVLRISMSRQTTTF